MLKTIYAKHDPAHCLVPGLFRTLKRGQRKTDKLDITYEHGSDKIKFMGFEPLDASDLRLLQGLVAMAGPDGLILPPEPETESGKNLRALLETKLEAEQQDGLLIKSSYYSILKEIGLTNTGKNIKNIEESLIRMSNVTIALITKEKIASFKLLSFALDRKSGKLLVALNPRVTQAVLGGERHIRIEMSEVRALKSDPIRLIHQRLCGWINAGEARYIDLETICAYVWGEETDKTSATYRSHKKRAREHINELKNIGWNVTENTKGKFMIGRPKTAILDSVEIAS